MQMLRFEDQIRVAYLEALRSPALDGCGNVVAQLSNDEAHAEDRDRMWTAVMEGYRSGPREPWAAVMLEALRPGLLAIVFTFTSIPSSLSLDDLTQQLVAEVLSIAQHGPTKPARWTPNRLLTRATTAIYDWVLDEAGLKWPELPGAVVGRRIPAELMLEIAELAADVSAGRLPEAPLAIALQRWSGHSLKSLATAEGLPFEMFRKEQLRAMDEIRSLLRAA